jgi:nucleolar protein 56
MQLFLLYETASGYCLFEVADYDEIGGKLQHIQKAISSLEKFTKMVKLVAEYHFKTAEEALENLTSITELKVSKQLKAFLTTHLPAAKSAKS